MTRFAIQALIRMKALTGALGVSLEDKAKN
jgi:hypothetical protein